jgi:hypothetical protein
MKALIGFVLIFWVICGFAGDWMIDGLGDLHWKAIARGPLTLIDAMSDTPVSVPHMG